MTRISSVKESNLKNCVIYHPEESQFLTTGSDKKITYWSTFDSEAIRMLDGCEEGEINALAITREGEHFISAGNDKVVRVWGYDEGFCYYEGIGHSGAIQKLVISPDQKWIVSVGSEGAVFIWKTPEDVINSKANYDLPAT